MSRILFVDDNEDHRNLIEIILSQEEHSVTLVSCGADAMRSLSLQRPDLIITDIEMSRYGGIELIQDILRFDPTIPLIIYSNHIQFQNTYMAYAADAFVSKTDDYSNLVSAISRVLTDRSNLPGVTKASFY